MQHYSKHLSFDLFWSCDLGDDLDLAYGHKTLRTLSTSVRVLSCDDVINDLFLHYSEGVHMIQDCQGMTFNFGNRSSSPGIT